MEFLVGALWVLGMVALCLSPALLVTYLDYLYKKADKKKDDVDL